MFNKLLVCFATLALTITSAASYNLTFFQNSQVNGKDVKAGEYKIDLKDNKVVIRKGKESVVEAPARLETAESKFSTTTVRYSNAGGKYQVQEIHVGGTNTKIVFETNGAAAGGI